MATQNAEGRVSSKRHRFGDLLVKEVEVKSADVLTLFSATVKPVILPAPGPGLMNVVLAGTVSMTGGSTDYATGTGSAFLAYKADGSGAAVTSALLDDIDSMTLGSVAVFGTIPENENIAYANIHNQPVVLTMDTDDVDTGNRNLVVRVIYMIVPCTT